MSEKENQQNPERSEEVRPKKLSDLVKFLVIANVVVFIAQYFFLEYFGANIIEYFALYNFRSPYFEVYQLITHMFLHAGFLHIFLNMFILWMFGSALEYVWKPKKFIFYFFFTGIGAALLHLAVSTYTIHQLEQDVNQYIENPTYSHFTEFVEDEVGQIPEEVPAEANVLAEIRDLKENWADEPQNDQYKERSKELVQDYFQFHVNRPSLGASGAVFGILLAFGLLFPNTLIYIYFLFPIKAKYFVILLAGLELYLGVFETGNVANFAHLGGMLFGFILLKFWGEKARN